MFSARARRSGKYFCPTQADTVQRIIIIPAYQHNIATCEILLFTEREDVKALERHQ